MKYKIETKPTLWRVQVSHGEYSDYQEENYFIRSNDRNEAWYLFKEFWKATIEKHKYQPVLILQTIDGGSESTWQPKSFVPRYDGDTCDRGYNTDPSYGDANWVNLYQLEVIEFKG